MKLERKSLPDGLEALRAELHLSEIMRLIERTARWVAPETFHLLPVWFPEYGRRSLFYKTNWSIPQMNTNRQTGFSEHKREGNRYANKALTSALGMHSDNRPNWSCCHIWGVDDSLYQQSNMVVQDSRFYSCVANMVLLPTPLKAFTDIMPEVKAMLRICANNLYGWHCEHKSVEAVVAMLSAWTDWSSYPVSWPQDMGTSLPMGVIPLNNGIRAAAADRLARIKHDVANAGQHYPREQVLDTLKYWKIDIHNC